MTNLTQHVSIDAPEHKYSSMGIVKPVYVNAALQPKSPSRWPSRRTLCIFIVMALSSCFASLRALLYDSPIYVASDVSLVRSILHSVGYLLSQVYWFLATFRHLEVYILVVGVTCVCIYALSLPLKRLAEAEVEKYGYEEYRTSARDNLRRRGSF